MQRTYSDKEIIEGCLHNDRFYQELLYRQYSPSLLRLCLKKLQDRDTAMLVVNNGFLKVFKNLKDFTFSGSFEGWIHRIVYRSIADYYRSEKTQIRMNTKLEMPKSTVNGSLLDKLFFEDLIQIAKQLPTATYRVFMLYLVEGYKHAEIAEKLNISTNTSKWHLAEAKKRMKIIITNNTSNYAT